MTEQSGRPARNWTACSLNADASRIPGRSVVHRRLLGREWLPGIERQIGRLPRKSIVHAPLDQQIMYACSDADWTLRLAGWLEQERKRIVEAEWKVAA